MKFPQIEGMNPFLNQAKIFWHWDRLCSFLKHKRTFPIQVELNPTNRCNMNCDYCITKYAHKKEDIKIEALKDFLKQFSKLGGKSIDWTGGGEPMIYSNIGEALEYASSKSIRQGIMTNGLFKPELLNIIAKNTDWVRFSLDTTIHSNFSRMKHLPEKSLDRILSNIEKLSNYSNGPRVVANMNLGKWNASNLFETAKKVKELGADGFQIRPILPVESQILTPDEVELFEYWLPRIETLKELEDSNFQIFISRDKFTDVINNKLYKREYDKCQYHYFVIVLNANGDVCVCTHHLNDKKFTFGNIYKNSLREIWESEQRLKVIEHCNKELDFSKCQVCCKGDQLNKILYFIQNPDSDSNPDFF